MAPTVQKQLQIKTGMVNRLVKELKSYEKELESEKAVIATMKADGKNEYDIKKRGEVLAETEHMIPDTKHRLNAAVQQLRQFMEQQAAELKGSKEFSDAQETLAAVA
eukprot:Clim_evm19s239 gene=Clim_evmTU19s239